MHIVDNDIDNFPSKMNHIDDSVYLEDLQSKIDLLREQKSQGTPSSTRHMDTQVHMINSPKDRYFNERKRQLLQICWV